MLHQCFGNVFKNLFCEFGWWCSLTVHPWHLICAFFFLSRSKLKFVRGVYLRLACYPSYFPGISCLFCTRQIWHRHPHISKFSLPFLFRNSTIFQSFIRASSHGIKELMYVILIDACVLHVVLSDLSFVNL